VKIPKPEVKIPKSGSGVFLYENDWLSVEPMRIELIFDKSWKCGVV